MANIFEQLAEQGGNASQAQPQQSQPSAQPASSGSGNIFDQLAANGGNSSAPSQGTPQQQPGTLATIGSDLWNMGKGLVNTVGNAAGYAAHMYNQSDEEKQAMNARFDADTARKELTYQQIKDNVTQGRYAAALSKFGELFDPHQSDPNDPLQQVLDSQWDSSQAAKQKMIAAAKAGNTWEVVQHIGGMVPVASYVDQAVDNYKQNPTRANLGHIITAAIPAFLPMAVRGAGAIADSDIAASAVKAVGDTELGSDLKSIASVPGKVAKAVKAPFSEDAANAAAQPEIQAAARGAASDAAQAAGTEAEAVPSIRSTFDASGESVLAKGKELFQTIDEATDGKWQTNQNALKAVARKLRTATEDDDVAEAFGHQQELLEQQDAILKQAQDAGVPAETADAARATWRQGSALQDLQGQMNQSVVGRAGVSELGEQINASKLVPRLHKLYDAGRLQDALGEDGAVKLIQNAESAAAKTSKLVSRAKLLKGVAKWGAVAGATAIGAGGASRALSGGAH